MDIQRTVTIVIEPDPDLRQTLEVFREVQADLSPIAFNNGKPLGPIALHRAAYHKVRGRLNSQMTISAIRAVAAAYQSAKRNRHRDPLFASYDCRLLYINRFTPRWIDL